MSFRLFIYYCTMCGGCAAYLGWAAGRIIVKDLFRNSLTDRDVLEMALVGMVLGLMISFGLAVMDSAWNFSLSRLPAACMRVLLASCIGTVGGFIGGLLGQWLFDELNNPFLMVLGWTVTGFLIGISLGVFDFIVALLLQRNQWSSIRKLFNVSCGGTIGGMVGGILAVLINMGLSRLIRVQLEPGRLWSPGATGFVALGLCIGLMIALAQVLLKQAWVRIEAGRRQGKELLLTRLELTIGRAESCDIGLFGDPGIDKLHARLIQYDNGYMLADAGSSTGTFLNGQRINEPKRLRSGDLIQVGASLLRFGERHKR